MSRLRRAALGAGIAAGTVAGGGAALAWRLSEDIRRDAMLISEPSHETPIEVVEARADEIALRAVDDPGRSAFSSGGPWDAAQGWFGIGDARRSGLAGPVRARRADGTVVRAHVPPADGPLRPGDRVRLSLKAFWPDPERGLGLGFREVRYPSPLGPMPAWLVPGARADAWAIVVHGRGSERWEGLRMTRALHRAGLTTLLVAYRNDPGAPRTDGLARFGHAEAADVAAALAYAGASGARTVVLGGLSMGGGIAAALLTRPAPVPIACAILDSPLLDVADAIRERARRAPLAGPLRGLPDVITGAGLAIAARRFAIAWGEVDHLRAADALGVPALIWHGPEDPVVPSGPSRRLARLRPDLVELREPARAAHTDAWNLDPAAYESAIGDFLARRAPGLGGAP